MSSSSPKEMELERACGWVERWDTCLEGRRGGTGLRGGSTGRSSKQDEKEEVGEGGGRQICLWGARGARGIGRGDDGRERPVAMGT